MVLGTGVFRCLVNILKDLCPYPSGASEPGGFSQLKRRSRAIVLGGRVITGWDGVVCAHAQARRLECDFRHRWTTGESQHITKVMLLPGCAWESTASHGSVHHHSSPASPVTSLVQLS